MSGEEFITRIEWEGFQNELIIDQVEPSPFLPPGIATIKVWRDDSYSIKSSLTLVPDHQDNDFEVEKLLIPDLQAGSIRKSINFQGKDLYSTCKYDLFDCHILGYQGFIRSRLAVRHSASDHRYRGDRFYEVKLLSSRIEKKVTKPRKAAWLTEWYLNGPGQTHEIFQHGTVRKINKTYRRKRDTIKKVLKIENHDGASSSLDCTVVRLPKRRFILHGIQNLGPNWSHNIGIEYRPEWGGIPDEEERIAIYEIISFIIGRRLLRVGYTAFEESGWPIEEVAVNPFGDNVISLCQVSSRNPVKLNTFEDRNRFGTLLQQLIPKYIILRKEMRLSDALWRLWLAQESALGIDIPILASGVEIIANAWLKSNKSKTKGIYIPEEQLHRILSQDLGISLDRFDNINYGDRIFNRIMSAYKMGANERIDVFFKEIDLNIGEIEKLAIKKRNATVHGSSNNTYQDSIEILRAKDAYEILFNRVFLKILGYKGNYIDRTALGYPERDIDDPPSS